MAIMVNKPADAELPSQTKKQKRRSFFGRIGDWLFSQRYFRFKLLSGTTVGVVVIIFLVAVFLLVSLRDHYQDTLRSHTIAVIRLGSLIENDVASLESSHRGFLLNGNEDYLTSFEKKRVSIKERNQELMGLILDSPAQRKRAMKVQDLVQKWCVNVADPEVKARRAKGAPLSLNDMSSAGGSTGVGDSMLAQARDILQSLQDEERISLNRRMHEQEWATQSTQILDFLPKLDRALIEMEKEKRGYLLTGENNFAEGYKRAVDDFYTYHAYLSILVSSFPSQAELLAEIRAGVDRWINTTAVPQMEAKRAGKDPESVASTASGETTIGDARQMLTNFETNELNLYQLRTSAVTRQRILRTSALALIAFFAVGLLVISNSYSFVFVRRQLTKLENAETHIRSVIENILDGMIVLEENGLIRSMNPSAERMFGCRDNEMLGHNFTRLVPKRFEDEQDSKPVVFNWIELIRRTGRTTLALGRTRKNITFPVEISLSEMVIDQQRLYVAMVRDVTERKHFEQQVDAEKENLAVTLRAIGDGVITCDVNGKVIMMNSEAEKLTGWTYKEANGQPLKTVFEVTVDLAAQAKVQKSGYRSEAQSILVNLPETVTLTSKDGSERVIEQVASPIRDNKNEIGGVVLVFRDITERQRSEAERRKAETLEQLGLLAGGIAHDFNNLLTAIIGNISLASLLLPPDDEMATRLDDAKNASMRARDLAQQLLTFARGGAPIKKTASIGKLIQDTVSFSLRGSHNRSEFDFGPDVAPAEIDAGQISQVIANLVVNADQAMPNGGTLYVSCDNFCYDTNDVVIPDLAPGDYVRVRIRDEGVGIPEKYVKRIFDPYFTTKPKGNGLGLATAYSIIKNHNGLLTVESQVHVGTTFTIYLPAAEAENVELPVEAPKKLTAEISGTGRVLVVDDEDAIRDLVEFTLTRLGYEVSQAATALQGVEMYQEKLRVGQRFDLVILDLTLPGGMGGKEALKKLIEIDPTVNAIVSSGYATDATMSRYQDFGFRGVIAKPYEAAELGKIVHDMIESSHVNVVSLNFPTRAAG
ncbi:MAG TPA: CHASE3 domain-containing protein [Chthoniobacterales bacterium]|nr:CHASE3 domain-containing protein [Chthoniobacterales bacterium]